MKRVIKILIILILFFPQLSLLQENGKPFLNLISENSKGLEILYSLSDFKTEKIIINGKEFSKPLTPGGFLPLESGNPDLCPVSSFITVPEFAKVRYILSVEDSNIINQIDISPAPLINRMNVFEKVEYHFNNDLYNENFYYPENIFSVSEKFEIRGINLIALSYIPYRYNPVTKKLIVYKKVRLKIIFDNPSGNFSNLRLRSKWFDPVITKYILNVKSIEKADFSVSSGNNGYEYIIITPNSPQYSALADTIRQFRNKQGIKTGVFRLMDIGGNDFFSIKNFIKNAYLNWEIPPVAVLLMADEGNNADNRIFTPYYNNQFISDFRYADMNDDNLPDLIISRIPVENSFELFNVIRNTISFEENPAMNLSFYNSPVTALGWETVNWFQICSEVVGGFFRNVINKNPVRINDVYSGNPLTDPWSTAPNTQSVLDYFGPQGLNYIPATPQQLGGFIGGSPEMVVNSINSGSFFLLHRDHGNYIGWGKPAFNVNYIDLLSNQYPVTVLSINCQNGQFNWTGGSCFSEKFLKHINNNKSGTVSVISSSDLSYPFFNDIFTWGIIDNLWDNFLPEFSSQFDHGFMLPAFANVGGKYFLSQSGWAPGQINKIETYYLFHHFGDCFASMFSEVPGNINLTFQNYIFAGDRYLSVNADSGTMIGISFKGDYINSAFSSGGLTSIGISGDQQEGDTLDIVVTKRNAKRLKNRIPVLVNPDAYLYATDFHIYDEPPYGNGNGKLDYSEINDLCFKLYNRGLKSAINVKAVLSSSDSFVHISDSVYTVSRLSGKDSVNCSQAFRYLVYSNIPDSHNVKFKITLSNDRKTWDYNFSFIGLAPVLKIGKIIPTDSSSNNNGIIEPGDSVNINLPVLNLGSSQARMISAKMKLNSPQFINIITDSIIYSPVNPKDSVTAKFKLFVKNTTPLGTLVKFYFKIYSLIDGKILYDSIKIIIGGIGMIYIGNGTKRTIYPYSLYFMDGRTEMLFTARELDSNGAFKGYITKIGFNTLSTNYIPLNNFTIKIKNTLDTAIQNFTNIGWSICFMDTVNIHSAGWNYYMLQTPFYWNGISNLLINVCYDNYFYSNNTLVKATAGPGKIVAAYFDLSSGSGCEILNGNAFIDRPDIAIEFGEIIRTENTMENLPSEFKLFDNFPNPFNISTRIQFEIPDRAYVEIIIYDILGREVIKLENGYKLPGSYILEWQSGNIPSGIYICRMKTEKYTCCKKLILIK